MVRGAIPKDPDKLERRNAPEVPWTELDPTARPVKAPRLPGAKDFSEETQRWYRTWASSPQATVFVATDWQRLHMLAPLVELYFAEPKKELLAEIRLNEERLGATVHDRLRARMKIQAPTTVGVGGEVRAPSRRRADPRRLQSVK